MKIANFSWRISYHSLIDNDCPLFSSLNILSHWIKKWRANESSSSVSGKASKNFLYKTAQKFWQILSKGGNIKVLANKHGLVVNFSDDSYATYRVKTSTKGSPAIEINIKNSRDNKSQKIHFISKGDNWWG